jgi:hypothetical protein
MVVHIFTNEQTNKTVNTIKQVQGFEQKINLAVGRVAL